MKCISCFYNQSEITSFVTGKNPQEEIGLVNTKQFWEEKAIELKS